jgi:hypothetical protein
MAVLNCPSNTTEKRNLFRTIRPENAVQLKTFVPKTQMNHNYSYEKRRIITFIRTNNAVKTHLFGGKTQ